MAGRGLYTGRRVKFFWNGETDLLEGVVRGMYKVATPTRESGSSTHLVDILVDGEKKPRSVYSADVAEDEGKVLEIIARQL